MDGGPSEGRHTGKAPICRSYTNIHCKHRVTLEESEANGALKAVITTSSPNSEQLLISDLSTYIKNRK